MKDKITHQDILTAMNSFASHVDNQLFEIKDRLDHVELELSGVKSKVNTLPTKDYLDDKLSDQKAQILKIVQLKHFAR